MDRRDLVSIVGLSNLAEQSRPFQFTYDQIRVMSPGWIRARMFLRCIIHSSRSREERVSDFSYKSDSL